MNERAKIVLWVAAVWLALASLVALSVVIILADAGEGDPAGLAAVLGRFGPQAFVAGVLLVVPAAIHVALFRRRYVVPARRLAEDVRVIAGVNDAHRAPPRGGTSLRGLAEAINDFAVEYRAMRDGVDERVREANHRLEQERGRLSALLAELAQSVIVCNAEGRILLYNPRAMQLLKEPTVAGERAPGSFSLIGLGRSIFTVFDREVVLHALDSIQDRLEHGDESPVVTFVTAVGSGRLIRVELARAQDAASASAGFVMVLHEVTKRIDAAHRRERALQVFADGVRASLSRIRVAADRASEPERLAPGMREELLSSISDEARGLGTRVDAAVAEFASALHQEWPLATIRGVDLIAAARRRVERKLGLPTKTEALDASIWIEVDGYSLVQAISYLAARLVEDFGVREIRFALCEEDDKACIEMIWTGAPLGVETTTAWQAEPLELGGEVNPQTLAQIVARHRGEFRYAIRKLQHRESFRISIPLVAPEERAWHVPKPLESRPEFYDFDLFHQAGQTPELDGRPLAALACTVFDTETTGLRPSEGDEIVSIGAVRVVNGRLLSQEVFEQLVDPGRPMSAEASRITGIENAMLEGQPPIGNVLAAFHRFCEDTVLVAHNAAFDMRFLSLKEQASGVRFSHPVLDTLLLSEVIHPDLESHRLEAIAERMGVRPIGRHTALGDAMMTAEVFLRMIPLLERQGIRTLAQAREASRRSRFAKVEY